MMDLSVGDVVEIQATEMGPSASESLSTGASFLSIDKIP
jgi:hypothetical protein